jgi:hypothetical protein
MEDKFADRFCALEVSQSRQERLEAIQDSGDKGIERPGLEGDREWQELTERIPRSDRM